MKAHTTFPLFLLLLSTSLYSSQNPTNNYNKNVLHSLACLVFGEQDVRQDIQNSFNETAQKCNLQPDEYPPIKYMKNKYSSLISFTWFGTWINELQWSALNDKQKEWYRYHEIAHNTLHHPEKNITNAIITALFAGSMVNSLRGTPLVSLIAAFSFSTFATLAMARRYEKKADIFAARQLCKENQQDVIREHIADLSQQPNSFSVFFHYPQTQIGYLKEIIQEKQ